MRLRVHVTLLILLVVIGGVFRLLTPHGELLKLDEAETTINSLQVVERGYPYDRYEGKPLFENASYILSSDPIYQYESTNYYGSTFEKNKGWLTYYYQAAFLKLFGFSTFIARLPFVLLFIPSFFVLYALAKKLFGYHAAVATSIVYAINPASIWYEYQARYFAPTILLTLLAAYCILQALETKHIKWYAWCSVVFVALAFTNSVTWITVCLFFLSMHWYRNGTFRSVLTLKPLMTFLIPVVAFGIWAVVVKIWYAGSTYRTHSIQLGWLLLLISCCTAVWMIRRVILAYRKSHRFTPTGYLGYLIGAILLIKPVISPLESWSDRLFAEVVPLFVILTGGLIGYLLMKAYKHFSVPALVTVNVAVVICFLMLLKVTLLLPYAIPSMQWVNKTIHYLDSQRVPRDTPVYVTSGHFTFMLYSENTLQLVWPIRQSYIDEYPQDIYFVVNTQEFAPAVYYRDPVTPEQYPFANIFPSCEETFVYELTHVYHCPPLML